MINKLEEELKLKGYSKRTLKSYILITSKFLDHNKNRDNIDEKDVRAYLLKLIEEGYSRETIRLTRAALTLFFLIEFGKKLSLDSVPLPKREKQLPKVLTKEEIRTILDSIKNVKHKLLIMFAYSSGVRENEFSFLRRSSCL